MNFDRVSQEMLKGSLTCYGAETIVGYDDAKAQSDTQTNRWAATENSSNNSWNCNFNNGNFNNNNKYNGMRVRPVVAYDTPTDFLNLVVTAFHDCCKNKRTSKACIDYCEIASDDLPVLAHELYTCTYQPGVSTCFLVKYPKYREVFAACFRDRIVHHFLVLLLNPFFERRFVAQGNVSYNCRKGFGTLAAQQAAFDAVKKVTNNYQTEAWVYRGDIISFFMSIDKRILWAKMEPFVKEKYKGNYLNQVLCAAKTIVFHCPEKNCIFNTDITEWKKHVETHKSLFGNNDFHGMPIGNLTTQIFVNFFMSYFDDFVIAWLQKHFLAVCYLRFVDDFLLMCTDKALLKRLVKDARAFLANELGITLHTDKYHFQCASHGFAFVGAYLKNGRIYLSKRTLARFRERVHGFNEMIEHKQVITFADLRRIEQVVNSYLGFCKGKSTYAQRKNILLQFGHDFYRCFCIAGHYERIAIKLKVKPQYLFAV